MFHARPAMRKAVQQLWTSTHAERVGAETNREADHRNSKIRRSGFNAR
jgi:hypothetical protein